MVTASAVKVIPEPGGGAAATASERASPAGPAGPAPRSCCHVAENLPCVPGVPRGLSPAFLSEQPWQSWPGRGRGAGVGLQQERLGLGGR